MTSVTMVYVPVMRIPTISITSPESILIACPIACGLLRSQVEVFIGNPLCVYAQAPCEPIVPLPPASSYLNCVDFIIDSRRIEVILQNPEKSTRQ